MYLALIYRMRSDNINQCYCIVKNVTILQSINVDGHNYCLHGVNVLIKLESHCHVSVTDAHALIVTCLLLMRTQWIQTFRCAMNINPTERVTVRKGHLH